MAWRAYGAPPDPYSTACGGLWLRSADVDPRTAVRFRGGAVVMPRFAALPSRFESGAHTAAGVGDAETGLLLAAEGRLCFAESLRSVMRSARLDSESWSSLLQGRTHGKQTSKRRWANV